MTNRKVKTFLLPWVISLLLSACTIIILVMFFPVDKLWLATLPIVSGSVLSSIGYNIYELIISNKNSCNDFPSMVQHSSNDCLTQ